MAIESTHERLLTVAEVAERLRVHPITVRRLIKAGRLRALTIGRSVRVREVDVDAFARPVERRELPRPAPEELERRRAAARALRAAREATGPIGFSTLELVRASRRELEERGER